MKSRTIQTILLTLAVAALVVVEASATVRRGFEVDVVVDGVPCREYRSQGTTYVEAIRGREYTLRLTNPTGRRVAVALAVDGLNTIDAKHTPAESAAKWVIAPYGTIEIAGWQVSDRSARNFFFTGERDSYGASLGQTENLGVIEAVFFLEKEPEISWWQPWKRYDRSESERRSGASEVPAAAGGERSAGRDSAKAQEGAAPDDDFAATGMGDRQRHDVRAVQMRLEDHPAASVRIRYEFRNQLVELGVLPEPVRPLDRRERASGFGSFCPEPGRR